MKRAIIILVLVLSLVALAGCGGNGVTAAKVASDCVAQSNGLQLNECRCFVERAVADGASLDELEQESHASNDRKSLGNDKIFIQALKFCADHHDRIR